MNAIERPTLVLIVSLLLTNSVQITAQEASDDASTISFPSLGSSAKGRAVLLAIDDHGLPLKRNLCYYLSKPKVRKEPVLTPSRDNPRAPDFVAAQFYGTVLHEKGLDENGARFRMWYYGLHHRATPSDIHEGPVCYAESVDGIRWTKPNLGQVEFKGSRDNNAIALPDDRTWFAGVIREESDPDPARRYKMVYDTLAGTLVFRTATSPDGIRWTASPHYAIDTFIELSTFYKHDGLYIAHGQYWGGSEGGGPTGRQGVAAISTDFDRWMPGYVDAFWIREPADRSRRGLGGSYDQVHLGVGAASLGNVVVGLFGLWHNTSDLSQLSCDLSLVISNDGLHFREPVKGHVYISTQDSPVTPVEGKRYPTVLCQSGNGILNVGDETRIYHGRWRYVDHAPDYYAEVALATLPRDRWGALGLLPHASDGSVWSAPITLPEGYAKVTVNADGARGLRVQVADERFRLLPEYSGANAGTVRVDGGLDCPLRWGGAELLDLGGRTVRLRVDQSRMQSADPRLYCVYIKSVSEVHELTVEVSDPALERWIQPKPGTTVHEPGGKLALNARRRGHLCPALYEFSHWDLGSGATDPNPVTTLTIDRAMTARAVYRKTVVSDCREVELRVGNAQFEEPDVGDDTRIFAQGNSAPGPWHNTGRGRDNCKIHIDHRLKNSVQRESPSGGQWATCYQEQGFPNHVFQVLDTKFVEGVTYELAVEVYWDYGGTPLQTYRLRLAGAESGEIVAEINQDTHAPGRGWEVVRMTGSAGASVHGENIKIILGGQDKRPLALDNVRVSAQGPRALLE